MVRRSDAARIKLCTNTSRLRRSLSDMGYPIQRGSEQIIALEVGTEFETRWQLAKPWDWPVARRSRKAAAQA